MPKRTTVTLPDHIISDLEYWAKMRGQGFATVCAMAIELGVKSAKASGDLVIGDENSGPTPKKKKRR